MKERTAECEGEGSVTYETGHEQVREGEEMKEEKTEEIAAISAIHK